MMEPPITTGSFFADLVIAVSSLFGVGSLIQLVYKRMTIKKDRTTAAHATNEGKLIDADVTALQLLGARLPIVEKQISELLHEMSEVKDERAELRAQNTILAASEQGLIARVNRQSDRITALEDQVRLLTDRLNEALTAISERDKEIIALRSELTLTTVELNNLKQFGKANSK